MNVEKSLDKTERDFEPFGMVPGGGNNALHTLECGSYLEQVTLGKREKEALNMVLLNW